MEEFFDSHAEEYRRKYMGDDQFYNYFFFERMEAATVGMSFDGKRILDIGSGTGGLYDYLVESGASFSEYVAQEISKGMLSQSNVPESNKICGDFLDLKFSEKYDYVFMLGVTTYLDEVICKQYFQKVLGILKPEGKFIVTFTNKNSLDIGIRNFLKPLISLFAGDNRIISQSFSSSYYSVDDIMKLFDDRFRIEKLVGLNHTFFPVSRMVPGISVRLARVIHKFSETDSKRFLSSDLLVKLIKDGD